LQLDRRALELVGQESLRVGDGNQPAAERLAEPEADIADTDRIGEIFRRGRRSRPPVTARLSAHGAPAFGLGRFRRDDPWPALIDIPLSAARVVTRRLSRRNRPYNRRGFRLKV
jgi:hypothetical protein